MKISIQEIKSLAKKGLVKPGNLTSEQADRVLDVLLYADMSDKHTQGLIKMTGTEPIQNIKPKGPIEITREGTVSAHINGNGNPAQLVVQEGVEMALQKCKQHGVGVVGINGTYSSNGTQAYYVNKIAEEGFVGIVTSRAPASVAPYGGKEQIFGTNPIGFGFPTTKEPIIFDMATSAITWFGLVRAKANREQIPEGVAMNRDGNITTDPEAAMNGATLAFDKSYKGAGLSMMIELLAGPLVGATFCNIDVHKDWGTFILAIDPHIFGDREAFYTSASELRDIVRNSTPRQKDGNITIPGERSMKKYTEAIKTGEIDVDDFLLNTIKSIS